MSAPATKHADPFPSRDHGLAVADLVALAQYALAAAAQLHNHRLSPAATSLFREWTLANQHLRALLSEFPTSVANTAARRALGMLTRRQLAVDGAQAACEKLLDTHEDLAERIADGDWNCAAEILVRGIVDAYQVGLVEEQS